MAEASVSQSTSGSTVVTEPPPETERPPTVVLKLHKPKSDKAVKWEAGTVDNEFMNKKKSKCCCVYEKPKMFGESSSEDDSDDDCSHCRGHKKKDFRQPPEGAAVGENDPNSQAPDS